MPVPVSITNPQGKGLVAAVAAELPSAGPFARLNQAAEQPSSRQQQDAASRAECQTDSAPSTSAPGAPAEEDKQCSIVIDNLSFSYPGLDGRPILGRPPLINNLTFQLKPGSRCLLIGANGAGKTTFLKVLAGKHMVPEASVSILGRPPFHDTQLTTSGDLAYVGGTWVKDVAFAGYSIPLTGDFPASRMIDSIPGVDPARKARLIKVLDIDPTWRMHMVSDGQRRRVQICVGLLKPFKVLLLDEITVDLDVLGRADLMRFLQEECEHRGATIIYATHIFDGLEFWPTHLAYLARGDMRMFKPASEVPELQQGRLLELVYGLLSEEADREAKERGPRALEWDPSREGQVESSFSYAFNNGWIPGTLSSSLSTNAVMRT